MTPMADKEDVERALAELTAALAELGEIRAAPRRLASLKRDIAAFELEPPAMIDEFSLWCIERDRLRDQIARLEAVCAAPTAAIDAAKKKLLDLNGITTRRLVTREIGELVLLRIAQGFRRAEVVLMTGLSDTTVWKISVGRYQYSDLPNCVSHGARGHRRAV